MVRISRHRSHRSHKHRDRSVSDDEGISKERKQKLEEEDSVRISRSSDQENRSCSSKYLVSTGKDTVISDHGKRRKDIRDRWNGGGDEDIRAEKEAKRENSEAEFGKRSKGKSNSSSNKKLCDMSEKNEEKRVDKERSGRESSSSLYKDSNEKKKHREKEEVSEKEKERKEHSKKHEVEVSVSELPEEMHNLEQVKEIGRRYKRRGEYGDNKKVRDSRDGYSNRSYKDGRYKEKYSDEHDREYKHYDDEHRRDEHSLRTQNEITDNHEKKIKLQCSDNGGNCYNDDHISKHRDSKGRKRPSEEIEDQSEMKKRNAKKPCEDKAKCGSSSSKYDLSSDRVKTDHSYVEKADSSSSNIRLKISPKIDYPAKDQNWDESRKTEDVHLSPSVARERISESRPSEKAKQKDNVAKAKDTGGSDTSVTESDLTPQSDSLTSPNYLSEKVPYTNEILPADCGQKSNNAAISNTFNNIPPSPSMNKFRSSSALGSYEEEARNQNNSECINNQKRRGLGTPWKSSGGAKWPSPVAANCFMPIQHGPPPLGFPHPAVPQFPSNVGPIMTSSNTPSNNIHMHSYSMQMWDGNPNMFREEPWVYGRQEWDHNRLLMSNRVRDASNDYVWNRHNGNMYSHHNVTQKKTEYSHDERVKLEKQVDSGSNMSLDESPAKIEISDSSKSLGDRTSGLFKMSSVKKTTETKIDSNVSYIHYYLSKLDISPDLAHPDVYEQCLFFMGGRDVKSTSHSLSMGQRKNNLDRFKPVAKSRQSLLTHPLDTIFQKTIFLFNKQTEQSKFYKKDEDFMDEDDKEATGAAFQANVQGVNNIIRADEYYEGKAKTQLTDDRVNAADSSSGIVVCVEVSEKNDNIANLDSVGVNISRIHLSAESTH